LAEHDHAGPENTAEGATERTLGPDAAAHRAADGTAGASRGPRGLRLGEKAPNRDRRRHPLGKLLRYGLAVVLLLLVVVMLFEEHLIFFPARYPAGDWQPEGLVFEDAWFRADDGTRLHGWYVDHPRPRAVLLWSHGNAGNLAGRADLLEELHRRTGVAVLIYDYRGYGRSEGRPSEEGILADARAARRWLAQRAGVAEKDIVLYGRSLGGAVSVDLAAADGARGLVLDGAFTSIPDVAASHFPWLPVRWLLHTRLDALSKTGRYHGPLLQIHGDADTVVPIELGRRLFAAANEPKRLLVLSGADHNDFPPDEYFEALVDFLDSLPPVGDPGSRESREPTGR